MKTIFNTKLAIGFDFDNTLANIDTLHKRAWLDLVEALDLNISSKELFVWPVSNYTRFDNFGNIHACFMENPNVTIERNKLLKSIKVLVAKLKVDITIESDLDAAVCLYYCKEIFLQKIIADMKPDELAVHLLPDSQNFLYQLTLTQPQTLLFVASSTSTGTLTAYLDKVGLGKYFGLVIGEDQLRVNVEDAWSLRDKPEIAAAEKILELVRNELPTIKPTEMLYIGDDSVRDGEFASAIGMTYVQIGKRPTARNYFLYVHSYTELVELLIAPLLKICRVKDLHTARYLARWCVDFIGLHAIHELPETSELHRLMLTVKEMNEYYPRTKTVLVSRSEDPSILTRMAVVIPTDFIQFHANVNGLFKQRVLRILNDRGGNIEAINVVSAQQGSVELSDIVGPYVLIDQNFHGGTGVSIDVDLVRKLVNQVDTQGRTIFLAGGIDPDNAVAKSQSVPVTALDIQSGLETSQKVKDIAKVKALFNVLYPQRKIKDLPRSKQLVAFSLQEQAVTGNVADLSTSDIDLLHADFSDGKLVSGWNIDCLEAVRYWQQMNPFIPVDIHLYAASIHTINQQLNKYFVAHNNIRCVFLHVQSIENIDDYRSLIMQRDDIQWGLSINYNLDPVLYERVCELLTEQAIITDLLVCLPGKHKEQWHFDVNAIKLQRKLVEFNKIRPIRLGIDRDVDPHRVSIASKYGVNHFVVGKYLQQLPGFTIRLNNIRRSYTNAHSSNH